MPATVLADPIRLDRRQAIVPQIHQILRERIVTLAWKPRRQLSRAEIAAEFDVSQTPVREALIRLEADGLIQVWPQSRTEVAPIDLVKVREVQFLRRALELEVALTLAVRPDAATQVAPARELIVQQRAIADDDAAIDRFASLDREFHRRLFAQAGQDALHALIVARSADLDRVRRLHLPVKGKRLEILQDHTAIVDAIAAGDPPGTAAAVRRHLSGTTAWLEALIQQHPEYF